MNAETQTSKDKLVQDFKVVYADVEELLRATASQTGEKVAALRERLNDHMHKAKDHIADAKDIALEKTREAARATDEYVHENPWKAVGVAAGIGLIVGMLIGRR